MTRQMQLHNYLKEKKAEQESEVETQAINEEGSSYLV